jgi:tight adherence protein B
MLVFLSLVMFFVVAFLIAAIGVGVAYLAFLKKKDEQDQAARSASSAAAEKDLHSDSASEPGIAGADSSNILRDDKLSTITFWDDILARLDLAEMLRLRLEQANLDWSVGRLTSFMLLAGLITVVLLTGWLPLWFSLLFGAAAALVPYAYLLKRRARRFDTLRDQFPDVLDSLARALRAGYPLSTSMDMLANEAPQPIAAELKRTAAEANLGRGWPQALESLGTRLPLLEVNTFIAAVQLHSRTGGKLSEVMGNLSEQMRESLSLQGEVRALAAHGKLTGIILTILPLVIAGMMSWVNPGYMKILPEHPMGNLLIGAAIGCLIAAHFVIRRIVDIKL